MGGKRRITMIVLLSTAALLSASMLAPAFGAPQAVSAASLAKKLSATLKIAKRADRNAKRAIKGLQVEGGRGPAGPAGARGAAGAQGVAGVAGAKGDPGTNGGQGAPGEPATRLWARVNSAGATLSQSGSTSSANLGTAGQYEVIFDRNVSGCSYQATQGELSGITGEVVVQPRSTNVNGVFVGTATSAGAYQNRAFHVAVFC